MTTNRKYLLAYSYANRNIATELSTQLTKVEFEFEHIVSDTIAETDGLVSEIQRTQLPVILIVSDNFLKSRKCMNNALIMLQDSNIVKRLICLVTDGRYVREGKQEYRYEPTAFDRVSSVIKYMNHWQDQYLDMRKGKKAVAADQEALYTQKLNITRSISSEIGEFLRLLRGLDYSNYDAAKKNDFELLFNKLGHANLHGLYKTFAKKEMPVTAGGAVAYEEMPATTENGKLEEPLSNIDINSIPGIDLLPSEKVAPAESPETTLEEVNIAASNEEASVTEIEEATATKEEIEGVEESYEILQSGLNDDVEDRTETTEILGETVHLNGNSNGNAKDYKEILEDQAELIVTKHAIDEVSTETLGGVSEDTKSLFEEVEQEIEAETPETEVIEMPETEALVTNIKEVIGVLPEVQEPVEALDMEGLTEVEDTLNTTAALVENEAAEENTIVETTSKIEESETPAEIVATTEEVTEEKTEEATEEETAATAFVNESVEAAETAVVAVSDETTESTAIAQKETEEEAPINREESPDYEEQLAEAQAFFDEGEYEEGTEIYRTILANTPENAEIRLLYADALAKKVNNYDEAVIQLKQILLQNDRHVDAYNSLAQIAEGRGNFFLAKSYYEKILSIDAYYPNVHYKLGIITLNHFPNQKKIASKYFREALKLNSRHVDANYQYAVLLNEYHGKYSKAVKHFKRTLKLNAVHPFAAYDLALLYHKLHEAKHAQAYYEKACKNNPELKTAQNDTVFITESYVDAIVEADAIADNSISEAVESPAESIGEAAAAPKVPNIPQIDKIVCITGATSGIGKATATVFAENGYKLLLTGRRTDRLQELQAHFKTTYGSEIQVLPFDVRDVHTVKSVVDQLDENWKNIDLLINNAGLALGLAPIHEGDITHWETMIDTNIKGLLYMTRMVAPHMVKRGEGHIINVCSTAGKEVYPNGNVYCATKHAVDALSKAMRLDLYKHNIRVSQVSPAHVEETEFALVRFEGDKERSSIYDDFNPLQARDVAETIYFMATRPKHVNVQDIVLMGTQQANSTNVNRVGRMYDDKSIEITNNQEDKSEEE